MSDALLTRIAVALEAIAASGGGTNVAASAPQPLDDLTGIGGAPTTGVAVTHDMLMALVQPLVAEESTKAQVKSVLNTHGLNRLGEATEAQYGALYAAFKAIGAPAPAAAAEQSLI